MISADPIGLPPGRLGVKKTLGSKEPLMLCLAAGGCIKYSETDSVFTAPRPRIDAHP
jgi:hypothetical protein